MATDTKPFWQSKTLWFNVITAVIAIAGSLTSAFTFTGKTAAIFTGILTVGNVILRLITNATLTK